MNADKKMSSNSNIRNILYMQVIMIWILALSSGCGMPKEVVYSQKEAQEVYGLLKQQLEEMISVPYAYSVEIYDEGNTTQYYRTEEYTVVYEEFSSDSERKSGESIWYKGRLYERCGDQIECIELPWEALGSEEFVQDAALFSFSLLEREAELTYKMIATEGDYYLLTAEYPITHSEFAEGEIYPTIRANVDEDGGLKTFTIKWSKPVTGQGGLGNEVVIRFMPYENSTDYQAERCIWRFGYNCGLSEEVVPALSEQKENREKCRQIIEAMDFEQLANTSRRLRNN